MSKAFAHIECKAHGSFREKPMSYTVSCEVKSGRWQCSEPNLRIVVPIDDGKEIIVGPGQYELEFAYDTVRKVARQDNRAMEMGSSCWLAPGMASELINLNCEGSSLTVSLWCPQDDCPRLFSVAPVDW